jgi:hypothetical protein
MENGQYDNKSKPWKENIGYLLTVYSILGALSALLIGLVLQSGDFANSWKLPISFLSFSFFCLILAAEKTTDALDENDVEKYLFCLVFYNIGVTCLIYGISFIIYFKYFINVRLWAWVAVTAIPALPWLRHLSYLFFKPEKEFRKYVEELGGTEEIDRDWGIFIKLFYGLRSMFNWFYSFHWPSLILKWSRSGYKRFHEAIDKLLHLKQMEKDLPHCNVYARLGISKISGVKGIGVFAIKDIPQGTNIFYGDDQKMVWIRKDEIKNTETEIKQLYDDFCIIKNNQFGCPKNFNVLTVGWYLNNSNDPNVEIREGDNFYAMRDIKKGEELTSNYDSYSDESNRFDRASQDFRP